MRKVQYSFNGNEWTDNSGFESHVFLDLPAAYAAILQVVKQGSGRKIGFDL